MVGIVVASHGSFAEGIKMSGQMIFGPQNDVAAVTLMPEMGPDDLRAKLLEAVSTLSDQKQVLFLVDLMGGTPWNQISMLMEEEGHESWVALGGLNLPMLVSAYGARMSAETAAEVAREAAGEAQGGVVSKPEGLVAAPKAAASAGSAAAGVLKPGTVLGDGKIETALVRVDSRLLHGQVAMAWSKAKNPSRIIVVSDGVAHNDMRKSLITEAAPPGIRANVIPVSKLVEIWKDPRFGATRAFFLFEKPQDVLAAVEAGVDFDEVNIGSMAHSEGKELLSDAIACDQDDIDALKKLRDHGVKLYAQKVPSDKAVDIWSLVSRAGF